MPVKNQAERFIERLRRDGHMAEADAAEAAYLEAKASGAKMQAARAAAEAAALRVGREIRAATGLFVSFNLIFFCTFDLSSVHLADLLICVAGRDGNGGCDESRT